MRTDRARVASPGLRSLDAGRAVLRRRNQVAVYQETARLLDARAADSADPVLAAVLRRRAAERRRRAERLRAELAADRRDRA